MLPILRRTRGGEMRHARSAAAGGLVLALVGLWCTASGYAQPPDKPPPRPAIDPPPGTILREGEYPIDLASALRLAGVENPELLLARQRVTEAVAIRQLAAAQALPNLNLGTNYDAHRGVLQQSSGNLLRVDRDSLYVG